ncbi:LuxR C-terminal-related transcriptional regulator [Nesterenkonia haasae]|uniref:LuxR C-terminal-related transcriptional regulator n=1 Tax=Nesterenkonia haasae TaxID=2587813 RepID=UPI001390A954|nr:LuxR C-terminal-related transcriptional regulator [Nesterenkonia haasae]NDK32461.1 response regulator transcription factor [Nesterenkonia haasae]
MTGLEERPPGEGEVEDFPSSGPTARDVHDGICQLLTAVLGELHQASSMNHTPVVPAVREHLSRAIALSEQVLALQAQKFYLKQQHRDHTTPEPLTDREKEVLERAGAGATNRQIATDLTVSETTVRTHLRRTFKKLNVQDRTSAVTTAIASGWITPPTNDSLSP